MPQIDEAHQRIRLGHHPQETDHHDPKDNTEDRSVDSEQHKDQDHSDEARDKHKLTVRAKQQVRSRQGTMDHRVLQVAFHDAKSPLIR